MYLSFSLFGTDFGVLSSASFAFCDSTEETEAAVVEGSDKLVGAVLGRFIVATLVFALVERERSLLADFFEFALALIGVGVDIDLVCSFDKVFLDS